MKSLYVLVLECNEEKPYNKFCHLVARHADNELSWLNIVREDYPKITIRGTDKEVNGLVDYLKENGFEVQIEKQMIDISNLKFIYECGTTDNDKRIIEKIDGVYVPEDSGYILVTSEDAKQKVIEYFTEEAIKVGEEYVPDVLNDIDSFLEEAYCNHDYEICGIEGCYADHREDAIEDIDNLCVNGKINLYGWREEFDAIIKDCIAQYAANKIKEQLSDCYEETGLNVGKWLKQLL